MLVHYRVLSSQLRPSCSRRSSSRWCSGASGPLDGHAMFRAVGWWITLATLNLHFTGSSFTLSRLFNRSITANRRRVITLGVAAAVLIAIVAWAWSGFQPPTLENIQTAASVRSYIGAQLDAGTVSVSSGDSATAHRTLFRRKCRRVLHRDGASAPRLRSPLLLGDPHRSGLRRSFDRTRGEARGTHTCDSARRLARAGAGTQGATAPVHASQLGKARSRVSLEEPAVDERFLQTDRRHHVAGDRSRCIARC